ncbi:tyrosine-type recombinase/integrase [Azospirillum sp. A39]
MTHLRWSEVDLAQRCLRLEDSKTGKSLRPLGCGAIDVLKQQPLVDTSPYVFPGARGEGPYQGTKREIRRILATASIVNAGRHALRHTFASIASERGYSDATIAGLLGHKGRGVTSRYVHRPDSALLSAAEDVCTTIAEAIAVASA